MNIYRVLDTDTNAWLLAGFSKTIREFWNSRAGAVNAMYQHWPTRRPINIKVVEYDLDFENVTLSQLDDYFYKYNDETEKYEKLK